MIRGIPYDAEIAFLESTGTQYIDTGSAFNSNTDVLEIEYTNTSTAANKWVFGTYETDAYVGMSSANVTNPTFWYSRASLRYTGNQASQYWTRHTYKLDSLGASNDGQVLIPYESFTGTWPVYLFALNNTGTSPNGYYGYAKIYRFKFWRNGVLVRDFIPVRRGTVGYLYDRVTRQLFGNMGTGAFVLGPDKSMPVMSLHCYPKPKPTARDYVQSGLVAMWDGIENAGWGVHDANATVWKDLVGNRDIELHNAIVAFDHIYFSKNDNGFGLCDFPESYGAIELVLAKDSSLSNSQSCCIITIGSGYSGFGICAPRNKLCDTYDLGDGPYVNIIGGDVFTVALNKNGAITTGIAKNGIVGSDGLMQIGSRYAYGSNSINFNQQSSIGSANRASDLWIRRIAIYSRALTAAEIAHNYAIDKERFNLP